MPELDFVGPHERLCDCQRCKETPGTVANRILVLREQIKVLCRRIKESERIRTGDLEHIVY